MTRLPLLLIASCLGVAPIRAAAPPRTYSDPLPKGAIARLGHARAVGTYNLVAVSPDGKWAFSGKWFDLATGKEIDPPVYVPERAYPVRFFSDGSYLVSTNNGYEIYSPRSKVPRITKAPSEGFDGTARLALQTSEGDRKNDPGEVALLDLRHPDPQKSRRVLANPRDEPYDGQLSADGSRAAWAEYDHKKERAARVCVYDLKASRLKQIDLDGSRQFPSMAISPDGKTVALYDGNNAYLYDSATGKPTRTVNDVSGHLHSGCEFTPDGKEVVFAMSDRVLVVPIDVKQPTRQFPVRKGTILADSRRMVTTVGDKVIRIYDLKTGKQLDDFSRFPPFQRVRFIGRHVAANWTDDGLIVTWDVRNGRVLSEVTLKPKKKLSVSRMRFSPDGRHVAAWSDTGLCVLAETATGKIVKEVTSAESRPIMAFFHPSRNEVAVEDPQQKRYRWVDLKTGKWTQTLPALTGQPIELSADARTLLVNLDGVAALCELTSGKPRWRDPFDPKKYGNEFNASNEFFTAALVRQGKSVVAVRQQNVSAFDTLTGRRTASFSFKDRQQGHTCAISADGRWLAMVRETYSAQSEPYLRLSDLAAEDPSQPVFNEVLPCPRPHLTALALNEDGSRLISAHYDGTCFVWDVKKLLPPAASKTQTDLWQRLGHADPAEAQPAVAAFAKDTARTVKLFASKLSPAVEVPPARITAWVKDLDSDEQDRRVAAERGLTAARDQAEEPLRAALQNPLSLEQMRRAERLLKKIDPTTDTDLLRQTRAVEILEDAGTKEAIALLERLAKGAPAARLTREAKESLARLKRSEAR